MDCNQRRNISQKNFYLNGGNKQHFHWVPLPKTRAGGKLSRRLDVVGLKNINQENQLDYINGYKMQKKVKFFKVKNTLQNQYYSNQLKQN